MDLEQEISRLIEQFEYDNQVMADFCNHKEQKEIKEAF